MSSESGEFATTTTTTTTAAVEETPVQQELASDTASGNVKRTSDALLGDEQSEKGESALKKAKTLEPSPTKVLHVRNLPLDCTEQELAAIVYPFGRVVNILMLKGKTQAFVQMEDAVGASSLVQYYASVQANIRGRPVYFQFSNRDEITSGSTTSTPGATVAPTNQLETPNSILLVTVSNLMYPVTIEVLSQVFSKYGTILKIIIFQKSGFQSLIQFSSTQEAVAAKQALDGQNIYTGCCLLRIQYSSMTHLNVKYNNDKSRDYTNPGLPTGAPPSSLEYTPPAPSATTAPVPGYPNLYPDPASAWGYVQQPATTTVGVAYPYPAMGTVNPVSSVSAVPMTTSTTGPTVVIVSNLVPEVTCDILFTLFGVYGDVLRVKILYNKLDTALIQFVNSQGCQLALEHLNGCPLFGKPMVVNFSRHNTVALPRGSEQQNPEALRLTKDFTSSPMHRYRILGSKNYQHICPPSTILHVSNLPATAPEEEVKNLFLPYGRIAAFKFFQKDKRMALIQMESLTQAVEALVGIHGYKFDDHNILKVAFSKNKI